MKKFSKLNESVKIDQSKLESILSELEAIGCSPRPPRLTPSGFCGLLVGLKDILN